VAQLPPRDAGVIEPALLARVPGCRDGQPALRFEPLSGGRGCNAVVRIDTTAGRFVLRRRHPPLDRPGSFSRNELACHRVAADAGLAPFLIDAGEDGAWLLMEYVSAQPWSEARLFTAAGIEALGGQLRQLHAVPLPDEMSRIDAVQIAHGYLRLIAARDPALADASSSELRGVEDEAGRLAAATDRTTLNHGDLQAANLLGPQPLLVDWEYAQRAHPTYDVACLLSYYPALLPQQERLLAACGLDSPGDRQILSLQQRLFARLNRLWQLACTPGTG
jgi:thiamine kinase